MDKLVCASFTSKRFIVLVRNERSKIRDKLQLSKFFLRGDDTVFVHFRSIIQDDASIISIGIIYQKLFGNYIFPL